MEQKSKFPKKEKGQFSLADLEKSMEEKWREGEVNAVLDDVAEQLNNKGFDDFRKAAKKLEKMQSEASGIPVERLEIPEVYRRWYNGTYWHEAGTYESADLEKLRIQLLQLFKLSDKKDIEHSLGLNLIAIEVDGKNLAVSVAPRAKEKPGSWDNESLLILVQKVMEDKLVPETALAVPTRIELDKGGEATAYGTKASVGRGQFSLQEIKSYLEAVIKAFPKPSRKS